MDSETYADAVIRGAQVAASGGVDPEVAGRAINDAIEAIAKQMRALKEKDYRKLSPDQVARSVSHTTKAGDALYRLIRFAQGQPDSRPDQGASWLRLLTNEELKQLQERAQRQEREDT